MKIGIMSDSHGQEKAVKIAVEKMGAVDLWIHCGDHDKDSLLLRTGAVKEVIAVQGNCDYHSCYKVDEFIEIAGKKIWITHGHQYKIKNSKLELLWWAKQYEVDMFKPTIIHNGSRTSAVVSRAIALGWIPFFYSDVSF